jgi:hypothetical protein
VRKLILIAAFALASMSVQAGERIDRVPPENDAPAATASAAAAPPATADTAKPQASNKQASREQASSRSRKTLVRRETDEQKARRIAAKYGISW